MLWWEVYAPHPVAPVKVIVPCNTLINLNTIPHRSKEETEELQSFDLPWGAPYFSLLAPEESWTEIPPCFDQVSEVSEIDPGQEGAGEGIPPEHGLLLQLLTVPDLCWGIQSYISSPMLAVNMFYGLETAIAGKG